jgi:hypothetical protein
VRSVERSVCRRGVRDARERRDARLHVRRHRLRCGELLRDGLHDVRPAVRLPFGLSAGALGADLCDAKPAEGARVERL